MLRAFLDLFFPPLCHACKAFIPDAGELRICPSCQEQIAYLASPFCPCCGIPFAREAGSNHLCGACLHCRPFDACRSVAFLSGPIQVLIHRLKYSRQVHLAQPLGVMTSQALGSFVRETGPDLILPVPLHRKRLRQRGYNQSQLIAEVLAKRFGVPMAISELRRIRWTDPQTGLSASERGTNVAGAFEVRNPAKVVGRRVLLVDDVLTTGSTVKSCAGALNDAGAEAVFVVTVARGIPP